MNVAGAYKYVGISGKDTAQAPALDEPIPAGKCSWRTQGRLGNNCTSRGCSDSRNQKPLQTGASLKSPRGSVWFASHLPCPHQQEAEGISGALCTWETCPSPHLILMVRSLRWFICSLNLLIRDEHSPAFGKVQLFLFTLGILLA